MCVGHKLNDVSLLVVRVLRFAETLIDGCE